MSAKQPRYTDTERYRTPYTPAHVAREPGYLQARFDIERQRIEREKSATVRRGQFVFVKGAK